MIYIKTVEKEITNEIIIKKSKFITLLIPVKTINDVDIYLDKVKNLYPNANHYCYSYIIGSKKKYNDDKEPTGTAGKPLLEVLEKRNMNNVLIVVIRYFGGIKLGSGNLLRTYILCATSCLKLAKLIDIVVYKTLEFDIDYKDEDKVLKLLLNNQVTTSHLEDKVHIVADIKEDKYQEILKKVTRFFQ